MSETQRFDITAQDTFMDVLRMGSGDPVVLVHGFGTDSGAWYFNAAALAQRHTVYAVDLPGFGRSGRTVGDAPIADYTGWLLRLLEREGIARAHVVGNSMGGAVALNFAADNPQRVDKLVLVSPAGLGPDANHEFLENVVAATDPLSLREAYAPAFADPAVFSEEMLQHLFAYHTSPGGKDVLDKLKSTLFDSRQGGLDLRPRLEHVQAPTLVVWGRHDAVLPVAHAEAARAIPGVRVEIFDDAGHVPQTERPERFNRLLLDFLLE